MRELENVRAYSEGLLKSIVDGIGVLDLEGKLVDLNEPLLRMMGLKKEEAVGMPLLQLLASMVEATDIERLSSIIGQLMTGASVGSMELVITTKDGTRVVQSIAPSVVKDDGGKPIMLLAMIRDISEHKRMEQEIQDKNEQLDAQNEEFRASNEELRVIEEELRTSNEELEATNEELKEAQEQLIRSEKLAAIGQLAGGVGHELRNPLGAIKNAVYYVRGKLAGNEIAQKEPRVMEFLDIIDDEINSSNKIISDLLGFSRVGKPSVSPTRLKKVIDGALSHISIPENIKLDKKLDTDSTEVELDPDQIQQVLINIITNAVQAMPEGGKLTIDTGKRGKFLGVRITDTGIGMPQETANKIFEPLFTTKAKGIGLGLAVCRSIIGRHGGQIEVESKIGEGTTFNIKLPLKAG
ncbi:ATP-binding protein [Chloroflexota bacterium]